MEFICLQGSVRYCSMPHAFIWSVPCNAVQLPGKEQALWCEQQEIGQRGALEGDIGIGGLGTQIGTHLLSPKS